MNTPEEYSEFVVFAQAAFPDVAKLFSAAPQLTAARKAQWESTLKNISFQDATEALNAMIDGEVDRPKFGVNDMAQLPTYIVRAVRLKHKNAWHTAGDETQAAMDDGKKQDAESRRREISNLGVHSRHCTKLLRTARERSGDSMLDPKDVPEIQDFLDAEYGSRHGN